MRAWSRAQPVPPLTRSTIEGQWAPRDQEIEPMSVTISVNNLTLCHKGSGGISTATTPDVCKTPAPGGPVPIPYPNIAVSSDLAKGTTTVSADGGNMCANYGSEFRVSTGDEPGTAGGIKSGVFTKAATWITYSFDVKLEGKGACRLSDKMFHNATNTVNAAGELEIALSKFTSLICPVICDVAERIKKGEKLPKGKSTWTQVINDEMKKHADDLGKLGVKMEKSVIVAATKGAAGKWGRKALKRFGVKGLIKKAGANVIPVVGQVLSAALTIADVGMTVADTVTIASELYDFMRFRPDFMIEAGGQSYFGEIKLEATRDIDRLGQAEARRALNDGVSVKPMNETSCGCGKS
jgi:hypothetical protein